MKDQKTSDDGAIDLFGNPIEPIRDRRGRPSFKISKENQDFVAVRVAADWSQDMIAEALGCDPKTLRKNFSRELAGGLMMVEGLCLDVLMRRVREGHIPSVRELQNRLDKTVKPPKKKPTRAEASDAGAPHAAKGKKEVRLDDAKDPGAAYDSLYSRLRKQ